MVCCGVPQNSGLHSKRSCVYSSSSEIPCCVPISASISVDTMSCMEMRALVVSVVILFITL